MGKTKTLIVSPQNVKDMFLEEVTKNSSNMSEVTTELWKNYIVQSITARKARYKEYDRIRKATSKTKLNGES